MTRRMAFVMVSATVIAACAQRFDPPPTPALIASVPDAIPCDRAVVIKAGNTRQGVNPEVRWLATDYPGHGPYGQARTGGGGKRFDMLMFQRRDGRPASVCFDITAFLGRH